MNVGDKVQWASQANGRTTHKQGTVVAVVPRNSPLSAYVDFRKYSTHDGYGGSRSHQSYAVAVPTKSGRGKPRLYWPVVSQLRVLETEDAT